MSNTCFNPYTPGAGITPSYLAGRDDIISQAEKNLDSVVASRPPRPVIYYGLRGVGKTVLLNVVEKKAEERGFICEHIEINETVNFHSMIAAKLRAITYKIDGTAKVKDSVVKALRSIKSFSVTFPGGPGLAMDVDAQKGSADSGILEDDLTEIMINVGEAAKQNGKAVCITIDELQYLNSDHLEALIASLHRMGQRELPIMVFAAGLPSIHSAVAMAKTYSERLFAFIEIDSLKGDAAKLAITAPATKNGVTYTPESVELIVATTGGYPFFIQEFGSLIWDHREGNQINESTTRALIPRLWERLDDAFFKVRFEKTTELERKFMQTMATMSNPPYSIREIAKKMNKKTNDLSVTRDNLLKKCMIYSTDHGMIDFTVPQFDLFLKRKADQVKKE